MRPRVVTVYTSIFLFQQVQSVIQILLKRLIHAFVSGRDHFIQPISIDIDTWGRSKLLSELSEMLRLRNVNKILSHRLLRFDILKEFSQTYQL